jgi:hypothetical protein
VDTGAVAGGGSAERRAPKSVYGRKHALEVRALAWFAIS